MLWVVWQPCSAFLVTRLSPQPALPPSHQQHINGDWLHTSTQQRCALLASELLLQMQTDSLKRQAMDTSLHRSILSERFLSSVGSCITTEAAGCPQLTTARGKASSSCLSRQSQRGTATYASLLATARNKLRSGSQNFMMGMRPSEPPPPESFDAWQPLPYFRFELVHQSQRPGSAARVGRIHTPHGVIDTPGFVPVGTSGALKAVTNEQADEAGVQLMFCNTYHLLVHPGPEVVRSAGGLHAYMGRDRPIITDSGGFQVFSLAQSSAEDGPELKKRSRTKGKNRDGASVVQVTEEGVSFRSYFDNSKILLTPESTVQTQKALGSDIIIPLDELPPYHVTRERLVESVSLSHRWMARSLREHLRDRQQQAMYAVVHGGVDRDLRAHSAAYLSSLPFDGMAIGGSLGASRDEMFALIEFMRGKLPDEKPIHLLGIADPQSVQSIIPHGVDTFDSCFPTRVARHGTLFTKSGTIHIKQGKYRADFGPIDPELTTIDASRSYMHHLAKMSEPLFETLASLHNIKFMNLLIQGLRERILADDI